jgi:hypothetical protein
LPKRRERKPLLLKRLNNLKKLLKLRPNQSLKNQLSKLNQKLRQLPLRLHKVLEV